MPGLRRLRRAAARQLRAQQQSRSPTAAAGPRWHYRGLAAATLPTTTFTRTARWRHLRQYMHLQWRRRLRRRRRGLRVLDVHGVHRLPRLRSPRPLRLRCATAATAATAIRWPSQPAATPAVARPVPIAHTAEAQLAIPRAAASRAGPWRIPD